MPRRSRRDAVAERAEQRLAELEAELKAAAGADVPAAADAEDLQEADQTVREENAQLKCQLTSLLRDRDLRAAAAAAGAINPDQVVALLRPRVQMAVGEDGRFVPTFLDEQGRPIADGDGPGADVQAFVGLFLSLPENANLVKANTTPGSGARPAGGALRSEARPRSLEEFNGLPEEQRMQWALEMGPERLRGLLGMSNPREQGFL